MATTATCVEEVGVRIRRTHHGLKGKFKRRVDSGGGDDDEIEFNGPDILVNFTIVDDGGTGLVFPNQPSRALWVHPVASKDGPCPPDGASWDQFEPVQVLNNNRTLQVLNRNRYQRLFKFSMNFTRDPTSSHGQLESWDPIGDNRNGKLVGQFSAALIGGGVAIAAGIAGAAAGYLACAQKSRRD